MLPLLRVTGTLCYQEVEQILSRAKEPILPLDQSSIQIRPSFLVCAFTDLDLGFTNNLYHPDNLFLTLYNTDELK